MTATTFLNNSFRIFHCFYPLASAKKRPLKAWFDLYICCICTTLLRERDVLLEATWNNAYRNLETGCIEFSPKDVDVSTPLLGKDPIPISLLVDSRERPLNLRIWVVAEERFDDLWLKLADIKRRLAEQIRKLEKKGQRGWGFSNWWLLDSEWFYKQISREIYSWSSPCDHSRKRPATVRTTLVKARLNCYFKNFKMKSSRKRLLP